jgi:hypothetical protein
MLGCGDSPVSMVAQKAPWPWREAASRLSAITSPVSVISCSNHSTSAWGAPSVHISNDGYNILAAAPPHSISFGGLRTPAPVCAAPPSCGRHPQTFTGTEVACPDSITLSALAGSVGGTEKPSAFAVLRLMISSNGCSTGRLDAFALCRAFIRRCDLAPRIGSRPRKGRATNPTQEALDTSTRSGWAMFHMCGVFARVRARQDPRTGQCRPCAGQGEGQEAGSTLSRPLKNAYPSSGPKAWAF